MRFREHRGGLDESVKTMVELPDRAALVKHIHGLLWGWVMDVEDDHVTVRPYGYEGIRLPDERIGWDDTFIVTVKDFGVIGFTDTAA